MGSAGPDMPDSGIADVLALGATTRRCPADLPADGHLTIIATPPGLAALEAGWRGLEGVNARPHAVFQTFDWVRTWAAAYALPDGETTLAVVAGWRGGRLVFVWPLMAEQTGPARVLRWLSEPVAQYGDILVDGAEDAALWMASALELLRAEGRFDAIWLRHVREDAAAQPYLAARFNDAKLPERAPWLDLSAFAGEAAYDARYTANQRKRRKKIRKALEDRFGPITFEVMSPGPDLDAAMAMAVAEKSRWIDARGRHNQILNCPRLPAFLQALSRANTGVTRLVFTCMRAGGQPLSWEAGLRFGTTHFGFVTAHANALTDYSPARLHMDYSQRLALKDGMAVFDLMVPHDPHKESWCSAMTATNDYHLPLSTRGWLFGRLYLESLRPALRAAYYRLPAGALKALKPILRH